jgi:aminoglycoside phosphotransferase (APT) family kinase protein
MPTPFYVPAVAGWGAVPDTDAIALITEDLGDHLLHDAVQQGQVSRAKALASAGELLAAFHQLPLYRSAVAAPPLGQRLTTLAARLPAPMRLSVAGAFVDAISLVVERPAVLCHGDLHLCNVVAHWIYGAQGLAVIDFEEIGPAVPEWDVAQTTVTTDAWTDADRQPLLSGYGRPVDTDLLSRLITVQCVRGWYYASRGESRDQTLWRRRLARSLSPANAPAPSKGHT